MAKTSRNERRKRAKAKNLKRTARIESIQHSIAVQKQVKANMSKPIERTYNYGPSSVALVLRNAGPSYSANSEISAMLRGKPYSTK